MSHVFGKHGIGSILGDVVGAVGGFLLGGPVGAAIGGGLGGFAGSAATGGNLGQDFLSGATGALGGFGLGEGAAALDIPGGLLSGAGDAAAALGSDVPVAGLAPAAQATAAAGDAAAPIAVSEAPVVSGGLSSAGLAGSSGVAASGLTQGTDLANALAAQSALAGGGTNAVAPVTFQSAAEGGSFGLGGDAGAPSIIAANTGPTVATDAGGTVLSTGLPKAVTDAGGTVMTGGTSASPDLLSRVGSALGLTGSTGTTGAAGQGTLGSILSSPLTRGAISGLGLIRDLSASSQSNPIPGMSQIQQLAQNSLTQGGILQSYLQNGTLPPAVQASVDQATQDGITQIKSRYAAMGVAPGSTQETEDIARLQQNAVVQGATLADQLLQQGISLTTLSGSLYNNLVGYNQNLNNQTNQAIAALAASLSGGGQQLKVNSNGQVVTT